MNRVNIRFLLRAWMQERVHENHAETTISARSTLAPEHPNGPAKPNMEEVLHQLSLMKQSRNEDSLETYESDRSSPPEAKVRL